MRSVYVGLLTAVLAGCAAAEPRLVGGCAAEPVQVSNREPGRACLGLGAASAHSGDATAYAVLQGFAAAVGANYVVLDAFSVASDTDGWPTTLRGRLFACPLGHACARR